LSRQRQTKPSQFVSDALDRFHGAAIFLLQPDDLAFSAWIFKQDAVPASD
jgi:hypothetical protein